MTTPSGQISFSDIVQEFGTPPNINIGAFRVNQTIGDRVWPLDTGVPSSGTIRFSELKGKTLNIVVDYPPVTGQDFEANVNATAKYINGVVVGNFKSLPILTDTSQTKKIHHLIRKTIGGSATNGVAFRTGSWNSSVIFLNFIISSTGEIIGKGGNGGNDGGTAGYGTGTRNYIATQVGGNGSPAIYATYPCSITIENEGRLQGGGGGGGGAGGSVCDPDNNPADPVAAGGGGGGGSGLPAGSGGSAGGSDRVTFGADSGSAGTKYAGGNGGGGASSRGNQSPRNCAYGGGGGGGAGPTQGSGGAGGPGLCPGENGENGTDFSGGKGGDGGGCTYRGFGRRLGGPGGANGKGVLYSSGVTVTITDNIGSVYFGGSAEGTA